MLLHFCAQLLTLTTAPHPTLTLTPTLQFWAQLSPFKSTLALNVVEEGMDERLAPLLGIGQRNGSVGENIGDHGATDTDATRRYMATAHPPPSFPPHSSLIAEPQALVPSEKEGEMECGDGRGPRHDAPLRQT